MKCVQCEEEKKQEEMEGNSDWCKKCFKKINKKFKMVGQKVFIK